MKKNKNIACCGLVVLALAGSVWADNQVSGAGGSSAVVRVDPAASAPALKPMNAVNNGPHRPRAGQTISTFHNFDTYAAAKIPFARIHDAAFNSSYGGEHSVDITGIFPDFSADENDPKSYDFACTDHYLKTIRDAGTEPFYRLGQKIDHRIKKYDSKMPADFAKWARICEHIVRHYNEGWADGFKWNITYWEIWNEPDLDPETVAPEARRCWSGSADDFDRFYRVAATHLKKCFPTIRVGGPALAWREEWGARFVKAAAAEPRVPMDFFSWHIYGSDPNEFAAKARRLRALLDTNGYEKTELVLNEWNYARNWGPGFLESVRAWQGFKGAAFVAQVMNVMQDSPCDLLMYYDARLGTVMNGMFGLTTRKRIKGYWPFYAWSRLTENGPRISATADADDVKAMVTLSEKGRLRVFLTRYTADDNVFGDKAVTLALPEGWRLTGEPRFCLVDEWTDYAETPYKLDGDKLTVLLAPNAFGLLEVEVGK